MNEIVNVLNPENDAEDLIVVQKDFIKGAMSGKPRRGHPEGKVLYHIREVLNNIDNLKVNDDMRDDLRIVAFIHDTFKFKVNRMKPKHGDNHHGHYAMEFFEDLFNNVDYYFSEHEAIMFVIKHHDDVYNMWSRANRSGKWDLAYKQLVDFIIELNNHKCLELFHLFYICDNATGDKTNDDVKWFENNIKNI